MKEFTPVSVVPEGFAWVSSEQSAKLIRANHPHHKRWHLLRFDLNGFDYCNVFHEATGELLLITVPAGQYANPVMFPEGKSVAGGGE